jgi:hypothetical protein
VDVIGHQAMGPDRCTGAPRCRGDQPPIEAIVVRLEKYGSRRLPRWVTWWGKSGTTTRAIRLMPVLRSADLRNVDSVEGNCINCHRNAGKSFHAPSIVYSAGAMTNPYFSGEVELCDFISFCVVDPKTGGAGT